MYPLVHITAVDVKALNCLSIAMSLTRSIGTRNPLGFGRLIWSLSCGFDACKAGGSRDGGMAWRRRTCTPSPVVSRRHAQRFSRGVIENAIAV